VYKRLVGVLIAIWIAPSFFAQQVTVPFDVCSQSDNWKRPSADVQSKIWSDPRYKAIGPRAYEWTHNFFSNAPDSASGTYLNQNLSGLWTDIRMSQCPHRDREPNAWTEIWALNYHVTGIFLSGLACTITVVPTERGYEIIQFRRSDSLGAAKATLRFVNEAAGVGPQDEWMETSPSVFAPVSGRR
jgi:hypothetical protein